MSDDFEKEFDDILGDLIKKSESVTYVCFVMDHSGSMSGNREISVRNFNEQLKTLKERTKNMQTLVSIIEFDFNVKPINKNKLIEEIEPMKDYWIGGTTALYDAIAVGVSTVRSLMDKDPREDKAALMLIQTDGAENASQDYPGEDGRKRLKKLIKELEDTGKWTFTFLAEDIEKEMIADIAPMAAMSNTVSYSKDAVGYQTSLNSTKRGLTKYFAARDQGITSISDFYTDGGTREPDEEYTPTMQRTAYENKQKKDKKNNV